MKMKKKLLCGASIVAVLLVCFCLLPTRANAASTSDLAFTLNSDSKSYSVTDCNTSASGSLTIPSTYNGKPVTAIGDDAFSNCTSLTSITIPDGVTSIGYGAFSGCTNLTNINIPEGITCINAAMFYGCSSLTSITIPNSVVTIYTGAFSNCTGLTSVTIPDSVTSIGVGAFFGCAGLTDVTISNSIFGISSYVFGDCTGLTSVVIPNNVTHIGSSAFSNCTGLTSITISDSVTYIGEGAFSGCAIKKLIVADGSKTITSTMIVCKDSLEEIIIPNSVTYVTEKGLQNSKNLTSVTFENNSQLTTIGYGTFNSCSKLTSVNFGENSRLITIDGYAFNKCTNLKNFAIPDGVTGIGSHAFYGCESLTSIRIPNGVTTIEDYAFWGCTNLESVSIGNRVVTIEGFAFRECSSLLSITIPDSVTSIGEYAFTSCSGLTSLNFGENSQLTNIGDRAFAGCSSLTNVTIPDSVTSLGYYAFRGCSNLISAVVGNGVLKLSGTFENCTSLTNITIGNNMHNIDTKAFNNCSSLTAIVIPEDANLGEAVFSGCSSLESITFSYESKETFGYYFGTESYAGGKKTEQFYYDENWEQETTKTYYIPATLKSVTVIGGEIPEHAFENCTTLVNVSISCPATPLGSYAFYNCTGLTNVIIESGLTAINEQVFYNCINLTSITIPNTVTYIWSGAFYNCTSLTNITIPYGVTLLGQETFYNCTGLTSITIPDSVTAIGPGALRSCRNLEAITIPFVGDGEWFNDSIYPLSWIFSGYSNDIGMVPIEQYYYRYGSQEKYTGNLPAALKSVTVTSGDIQDFAFWNCTLLTNITIPDNAISIGYGAFYKCTGLTNFTMPDSVTSIGKNVFSNCTNLTDIIWGENSRLTIIGDTAFYNCTSISSIIIPKMVTNIGKNAFGTCSKLSVVFYRGTEADRQIMRIDSFNTPLTSAVWHYQVAEAEFAGQNCYYCAKCDNYFLPDGNYVMATVVFKDWDGTVLETKQYKYGDTIKPTNSPTREHKNALVYKWVFTSWDNELAACTGNAEYTAIYTETYVDYTIVFKNWNGDVLSSKTYHYGDAVTAPADPTKAADNTYTYTFAGWDKTVANCAGNTTYTAIYTPTYINYTVVFKNWDNTVLSTNTYHYGDTVTAPANPTREADSTYTYAFAGWDKTVVACAGDTIYTATYLATCYAYAGGAGTVEDPFLIETKEHLNNVRNNLDAHYKMIADIVFTEADFAKGGAFYNNVAGWVPIGTNEAVPFIGVFDGDGFTISGLQVKPAHLYDSVGLFGYTSGNIKNLNLCCVIELSVHAEYGYSRAGGITGSLINGTIVNCTVSGSVSSSVTFDGNAYAGGIAGYALNSEISNCGNECFVSATDIYNRTISYAGGIVGEAIDCSISGCKNICRIVASGFNDNNYAGGICGNSISTKITTSFNTGSVQAEAYASSPGCDAFAGGIAGATSGEHISDCFNVGNITTDTHPEGALIGNNWNGNYSGGIVGKSDGCITLRCYNIGKVFAAKYYGASISGGIVGYSTGPVTDCYYLDTIEKGVGSGSDTAIKCSNAEMQQASHFENWDFGYVWEFTEDNPYLYPTLATNEHYTAADIYTIVFTNDDGTELSSATYYWQDEVVLPNNPTKAADNTYTYTFKSWDKPIVMNCEGDATYTATYTSTYINYTVIFKNWNGTVLSAKTYHYGDAVTAPANPTRPDDDTYTYTFTGWDNDVIPCEGNATYTATYSSEYISYTVVFKDWDGTIIPNNAYNTYYWGEPITVPTNPTKEADNTYTYTFAGWDKTVVNCAGDATYTATYTATYIEYTVEFKDWNGTILSTKTYHWGDVVTAPSNPTRPDDSNYTYTFTGWDNPIVACNGNAIYRAVYSSKSRVPSTITSSTHTISGGTISNISTGTTVSALVGKLNEKEYVKVYNGNQEVSGSTAIGTGMVVKIMDGNTAKASYTIIVTGDTNGDGKITVTDMLAVKAYVLQKSTMTGATAQAADTSGDNAISITDFIQLKAHILGKSNVEPRSANAAPAQLLSVASVEPATQSTPNTPAATVVTANYTVTYAQVPSKKAVLV